VGAATPIQFASENSSIGGTAGEYPLDPPTLLRIGRALGRWLTSQRGAEEGNISALFAQDTRITSPMLMQALATGLMAEGVTIVNAGVLPLPGVTYLMAANDGKFDLGLYIGAAGAAADHNGFTLIRRDGFPLSQVETSAIEQLIELLRDDRMSRGGAFRRYSLLPASGLLDQYMTHLTGWCAPDALNGWKIVLDCANGAAHKIAPEVFRLAGAEIVMTVNDTTDGSSINHLSGSHHVLANPGGLIEIVQAMDAHAGIAFSGDGDGVVVVTPQGTLLDGDVLLAILALEMKAADNLPDDAVVGAASGGAWLEKSLRRNGIELVRSDNVLQMMRQRGLRVGGYPDGRILILDDSHQCADGIYTALLLGWLTAHHQRSGGPTLDEVAAGVQDE
jgi:phosphoglucosamine mutase